MEGGGEVEVTYLALVQEINWHVVRRGGEVGESSAVTGIFNIFLLGQERRLNIKVMLRRLRCYKIVEAPENKCVYVHVLLVR